MKAHKPTKQASKPKAYLVADIGGTNCRLALYDENLKQIAKEVKPTNSINSLTEFINYFMKKKELIHKIPHHVVEAVLAVAGPIEKDRKYCKLTNASWDVDVETLKKLTPLLKITLLNDFEAVGYGVEYVSNEKKIFLSANVQSKISGAGSKTNSNVHCIIGPGTGLGMSILIKNNHNNNNPDNYGMFVPLASEGGHAPLAIRTEPFPKIAEFLVKKNIPMENEELLSGRGLALLYQFAYHEASFRKRLLTRAKNIESASEPAVAITKAAFESNDPVALEAIELFVKALAAVSQQMALLTLCSRLYIAGGIPPRIRPMLEKNFMTSFVQNSKYGNILSAVEVVLIIDEDIGLLGAAIAAKNGIFGQK